MPLLRPNPTDRWSVGLMATGSILALGFVSAWRSTTPLLLIGLPVAYLVYLTAVLIIGVADLVTLRPRHLLSVAIGGSIAVIPFARMPAIRNALDEMRFELRRQDYDTDVAEQRKIQDGSGPIRMVIHYEDQSKFVTTNVFYYIVYDEQDRPTEMFNSFWPSRRSPTGRIGIGEATDVTRLRGHYYHFYTDN